ncbi:hypothetical protein N7509_003053 [Penicillium cosmopolitanum]|uniref:Aflatoxin regulatory protein domain-containing protein n=1 Tax=Penicillium cosmopolitanum TaxID=1131564 RepID=A0A9X0BB43_9EURO|nr:uncharacterized protein N7509_003053 [Penicillium cosmopolitanum]KAJ5403182.1 hypothetical protein N7509_003053 [Penicillium cosmopolitanum]
MTDNLSQDLSWIRSLLNTPDLTIPPLDRHGDTPKLPLATDQYSPKTPIPTSSHLKSTASHAPQLNSCNCFQQLTEQLSNFKALSHSLGQLRSDFILTLARDALARWQTHLSCPSCQHNEDKDILILSVMALRALLNLVKEVGQHELQSPHHATGDEDIGVSSELFDADHSCLGTYRLACEERRIVVDLLLHRTLRSLNQTTEHLRQKSLRMAGSYARRNTTSNLSSRSESSVSLPAMSSSVSCILPDDLSIDGGAHDVGLKRDKVSLDEHDNYLQESLQGSTATIEFLLVKLQSHDMNQRTDNSEIFGF